MSGDGAPSLGRWVQGWRWVLAGARGRAGTVNRRLSPGAEPGSETCDPASQKAFCRRPNCPIEFYFHSWKKSMGCDYCCLSSRCFLWEQKIKSQQSDKLLHHFSTSDTMWKKWSSCDKYLKPTTVTSTHEVREQMCKTNNNISKCPQHAKNLNPSYKKHTHIRTHRPHYCVYCDINWVTPYLQSIISITNAYCNDLLMHQSAMHSCARVLRCKQLVSH